MYDGFISYSHAADGLLAPALQAGLQRLAKPWNSRRALRIFRDETGLSTNPHLWSAIEGALDESEWFVLLASAEAAGSEWVNKEISHWLATKSVDRILPVVTEGTWDWDPDFGDFTVTSSAVPEALRGAFRDEPRHLDLRWARSETDLDLRNSRFRSAVADLAAPMHGIAKDELESEDIRQHRRARRLARGGVTALTLLVVVSLVTTTFALLERNDARSQRKRADRNAARATRSAAATISRGLASDAAHLVEEHRIDGALLLSLESHNFAVASYPRGTGPGLRGAASLLTTLGSAPSVKGFLYGLTGSPELISYSSDGTLVASVSDRGDIRVWAARTRQPLAHQPKPVDVRSGTFVTTLSIERARVLATATSTPGTVRLWDLKTNRPWPWQPPKPDTTANSFSVAGAALSDTGVLAVASGQTYSSSSELNLWNIGTGRRIAGPIALPGASLSGTFSRDGRQLAIGVRLPGNAQLAVQLFDTATGKLTRTLAGQRGHFDPLTAPFVSIAFSPDGTRLTAVASATSDGAIATWNLTTGRRHSTGAAGSGAAVEGASHDGHELVTRSPTTGATTLIDAGSGIPIIADLALPRGLELFAVGEQNPYFGELAAFDPADQTLAIATAYDTIELVNPDVTGETTTLIRRKTLSNPGDPRAPSDALLSPTGRFVALPHRQLDAASSKPKPAAVELIDTTTGRPANHQPPFGAFAYAFGADDTLAAATADGVVVWDPSRGRVVQRISDTRSTCATLDTNLYEPLVYAGRATDGHVALACSGNVAMWKLGSRGDPVLRWHRRYSGLSVGTPLVLSPDGSTLGISEGTIETLDADTGRRVASMSTPISTIAPGVSFARPMAFSDNGRSLAVDRSLGSVDLFDARSGSLQRTLFSQAPSRVAGGSQSTKAIAFSPDGATVVAVTGDDTLETWDATSGSFIAQIDPRQSSRTTIGGIVHFSPDGHYLNLLAELNATSSTGTWSFAALTFAVDDWGKEACDLAGRNLTRQEWNSFLGNEAPYRRTCPQWPAGT